MVSSVALADPDMLTGRSGREGRPPAAPAAPASPTAPAVPEAPVPFDRDALMARVESDVELLSTLVAVFKADRPSMMAALEEALLAGNAVALADSAHTMSAHTMKRARSGSRRPDDRSSSSRPLPSMKSSDARLSWPRTASRHS